MTPSFKKSDHCATSCRVLVSPGSYRIASATVAAGGGRRRLHHDRLVIAVVVVDDEVERT